MGEALRRNMQVVLGFRARGKIKRSRGKRLRDTLMLGIMTSKNCVKKVYVHFYTYIYLYREVVDKKDIIHAIPR